MGKRDDNREERRRAILAAARGLFAERGFHAAGMAEIAARSGVTPANLYRYFPSKSAIVCAIADAQREQVARAVVDAQAAPDARSALARLLTHFIMTEAGDPDQSRLWLEILVETARNPEVRQAVEADDAAVKAGFRAVLQRGIAEGGMRADLDLDATVVWLIALLDGAVGRMAIEPEFDLARATDAFIALSLRALACPEPRP